MRKYSIVEMFKTIQGEGHHAGVPSFFIRFAGCNMWSGDDDTRTRDAERNGAECPRWCDTDFKPRESLTAEEIAARVPEGTRHVVFTGGEPLLQLDRALINAVSERGVQGVAVETNGTVPLPKDLEIMHECSYLWITVSPKVEPAKLKMQPQYVNELKVVFPAYDPAAYNQYSDSPGASMLLFVQPEASTLEVGKSLINASNVAKAVTYVIENPRWNLSMQLHKILHIP